MLFIGNLLGRIWGFFVVRPSMKKAINDAENSGDFEEYKKAMDDVQDNIDNMKEIEERIRQRRQKNK